MPEGESPGSVIESRRTRFDLGELRYELHLNNLEYFPQGELFDDATKVYGELETASFKGLREDACRFSLLKVVDWFNEELNSRKNVLATKVIGKGEIVKTLHAVDSGSETEGVEVKESDIDTDFFLELSEYSRVSDGIMKIKGWDEAHTKRFVSRVANNIFRSGLCDLKESKIPLDLMAWYFARVQDRVLDILESRKGVALEYALDGLAIDLDEKYKLVESEEKFTQTIEDKKNIEGIKKKTKVDQIEGTLKTVLDNTQYIRHDLIPEMIVNEVDSRTAFWKIHAGEFRGDPIAAQMLVSGDIASMFGYVAQSGTRFYDQNIGSVRVNEVMSGRFAHVQQKYLMHLQEVFFGKIDQIESVGNEDDFLDIETMADIAMISLHLPFDGAGRTKEDFFVYLAEKYGYPLTFSVLGFRDIGSPILSDRNDAISTVKMEINSSILKRFSIESKPLSDKDAIKLMREKFNCGEDMAKQVFHSEKALTTSRLVDAIGNKESVYKFASELPSFLRLKEQWKQARTMRFLTVPEEYKDQVAGVASVISAAGDVENAEKRLTEKISYVKTTFADAGLMENVELKKCLSLVFAESDVLKAGVLDGLLLSIKEEYSKIGGVMLKGDHDNMMKDLIVQMENVVSGREVFNKVFRVLDELKVSKDQNLRLVAMLLEVRALEKVPRQPGRNPDDLLFQVFPNNDEIIKSAAKFGTLFTKLKAKIKLAKLRQGAPKFVEWKKPD